MLNFTATCCIAAIVDDFTGAWPDGVAYARAVGLALRDAEVDALHWASFDWKANRATDEVTPMPVALRESSGKLMIVNGGITEKANCDEALRQDAGDLLAVGRPLFAHPDWPHIIRSGEPYPWAAFDRRYVVKPPYVRAAVRKSATVAAA